MTQEYDEITQLAGTRAANLYSARGLCCSEAVLLVLNHGFGGGLSTATVRQLGSGFCGGMGDAGCVCGALSGAVMGLGLFLAPDADKGLGKKQYRACIKVLHDRFHQENGSTCCREITKDFTGRPRGKIQHCMLVTEKGAILATELLLSHRPDLLDTTDSTFLSYRDSTVSKLLNRKF